jgi:hypothetical protein
MVGIMTVVASIVRLVIWIEILDTANDRTEDINLAVTLALQWGMIEAGFAFFVSQLPALGAYLNKSSRNDIAQTIRYAASAISIKSLGSGGSRNQSWDDRDVESGARTNSHQLGDIRQESVHHIRRDDVYEVKSYSANGEKAIGVDNLTCQQ